MKYCTLEEFENKVLNSNGDYYILSKNFFNIRNYETSLNHLSIFDKTERGTISQDKEIVNKILSVLKSDESKEKESKESKEKNESTKKTESTGKKELSEKNQSAEKTEITEKKELSEKIKSPEKNESLKEKELLEKVESTEKTESTEKKELSEKIESTEKKESSEKTESIEKKELSEKNESTEKKDSSEKTESIEKKELSEKVESTEKTKSTEKKELLKNLGISELEKSAIGSIMGMAIGDAMGSTYEFQNVEYDKIDLFDMERENEGNFNLEPGQWTDDSSMGLCLADSLLVNNGDLKINDLMLRFLAWNFGGYNNAFRFNEKYGLNARRSIGLGGNISMALYRYFNFHEDETQAGDKFTSGNGSIMRNAAIPICFYYDINLACDKAKKQSLSTHRGLEAKECCSLLTFIIITIFNEKEKKSLKEILDNIGDKFETSEYSVECLAKSKPEDNRLDRDWNWKKDKFYYNEQRAKSNPGYIGSYAMDNMAMSLHIVYHTKSFKEAIIKAVNTRGDSDSVASVVGQIAGAYYPIEDIPSQWIDRINKWDDGEIALRGYMLSRIHSKKSKYDK